MECAERSSLYSMALHWHKPPDSGQAQLWVAAGTAFLHILVWQLPSLSLASLRRTAAGNVPSSGTFPEDAPEGFPEGFECSGAPYFVFVCKDLL